MENKNYVCYEDFGAVGDGVTDDMPAIVKAHDYANANGLRVMTKPDAVYYIGGKDITAVIKTSVDFSTSKFIIDDRNLENVRNHIFSVESDFAPFDIDIKELRRGQDTLDIPVEGMLLIRVFNGDKRVYIRKGVNANDGTPQSDVIAVDKAGCILTTVDYDYDKITRAYAKRVDDPAICINGGIFTTIANQWERVYNYHYRNFKVTRSNVTFRNLLHLIEGEGEDGAPYEGFIRADETVNLTIKDCTFTPHKTYLTKDSTPERKINMGTYEIYLTATVNTVLSGVNQTRDIMDTAYWGLMGSNFCKDILLEDCNISRFDAHMGVSRGVIRRCRLGHQCLNLIGFDDFLIEDTFALGNSFVSLRGDYGSTFRGNLTIRNCVWKPKLKNNTCIISAANDGSHDFGYRCYMPTVIKIENLTVEDEDVIPGTPLHILPKYDSNYAPNKPFAIKPTEYLRYSGIVSKTGRVAQLCPDPELYPCIEVDER